MHSRAASAINGQQQPSYIRQALYDYAYAISDLAAKSMHFLVTVVLAAPQTMHGGSCMAEVAWMAVFMADSNQLTCTT
jgi:hypothetical protein